MSFSSTISHAILSAARPVRLPARHCRQKNSPRSTVNSMSMASLKCVSSVSQHSSRRARASLNPLSAIDSTGCGVRIPATTSSPCAFTRYSPYASRSPVAGLRVKHTPDAHSAPAFPYTIACTFTAVPLRCVTRLMRRYVTARSLFQDANTASVAMRSCVVGSSGNAAPRASYTALYSATSSRRSATSRSTSDSRFLRFFMFASLASNSACGTPSTTSPNMSSRRR